MIISASRRTDIPAFYGKWFINRIKAGFVYVRNPFNPKQVSKVILSADLVDCIVFWTKNPKPFLPELSYLDSAGFNYYFLFTITSYGDDVECGVGKKKNIIAAFKELSELIGAERVIWRYDPILFSQKYNPEYHIKWFRYIAGQLSGYTDRCIISFLDAYKKIERNISSLGIVTPSREMISRLVNEMKAASEQHGLELLSCAEVRDLTRFGVRRNKCIDDKLISAVTGRRIVHRKDKNQRDECLCTESVDIGAYNSCPHFCSYCYANAERNSVLRNIKRHNPDSPFLIGDMCGDEKVTLHNLSCK